MAMSMEGLMSGASTRNFEWDMILSASQKNNSMEVLRLLKEEGVPPSHKNVVGQTGLHIAGLWGCVESMQILIDAGADVNAQNEIAKMTPLQCAIRGTFQSFKATHERRVECVKILLQAGADCGVRDMKGKDAFECIDVAIREARVRDLGDVSEEMEEMREVLRAAGANASPLGQSIELLDVDGVTLCLGGGTVSPMEIEKGLLATAEKFQSLLEQQIAVDEMYESLSGIMKLLLDVGANANACPPLSNATSPLTEAPLHIICSGLCTAYSMSPESAAAALDPAEDAVRQLRRRKAKVCSATMALLPMAAMRGKEDSVRFLVDVVRVDPNYRGRQGMTGLIMASRGGKADVVRLLMTYENLDVDMTDDAGKKALDYATANKKAAVVELLTRQG